jgi:hypothetical protein
VSLASAASQDGYGSDGLLIGVPHAGKVAAFQIGPGEVPTLLWVALQRPPDAPDADACGSMALGPHYPYQPLGLSACRVDGPEGGVPVVFMETATGTGNFVQLGAMQPGIPLEGTWGFGFTTSEWDPPDELRFATLGAMAGCRVEVRQQGGTVLLRAVVPEGGAKRFSRRARLESPPELSSPRASGSVRVVSSSRWGTARVSVATHGLPREVEYVAWIEDGPSSNTYSIIGNLIDGSLVLDSAEGDALPGCTSDGASLTGRILEIRDGASVALRGLLP